MAQRIGPSDVQAICSVDSTVDIQPFIVVASLFVDTHLASVGHSAAMLTEIERWLAAHFLCVQYPRFTEMGSAGERLRFEGGASGEGLKSTRYGQQALALDTSGTLAQLASGVQRASFAVL